MLGGREKYGERSWIGDWIDSVLRAPRRVLSHWIFVRIEAVQNCGNLRRFGAAFFAENVENRSRGQVVVWVLFCCHIRFQPLPCLGALVVEVAEGFVAASM